MKIQITGASNFVNRMFEACGQYQWAREFLKNSLEAGATRVEFGIEWQAVEKLGVYRRVIADNGHGMTGEELCKFFSTLGEGAKKIGGVHENFGVGAKVASLPWNPDGVVVISYKKGKASMIWMVFDPDSDEYELTEFRSSAGTSCVIEPTRLEDIDWAAAAPEWVKEHGTVVVLLGSEEYPDTIRGNAAAGEKDIKGLSVYLNSRFWDLSGTDIHVVELRSDKKSQWPQGPNDRDDARRPNARRIWGARCWLVDGRAPNGKHVDALTKGKLLTSDVLFLDGQHVKVEWYLWEGERPAIHSHAKRSGYIAVRYKDELFHITSSKVHFRWFGVVESAVQANLTIILEPQLYNRTNGRWGIHPDQSRNRLIFTGNGDKGTELPMSDWGMEFAEHMPEPIRAAIRAARGDITGSIEDEEYRKRLQDRFGRRWSIKALAKASAKERDAQPAQLGDELELFQQGPATGMATRRKHRKSIKVMGNDATLGGADSAVEREAPVDVPKYRLSHKDDFERPWHLALWAPNSTEGPTVLINVDSPILQEVVEYHQSQYADVHAEDVANTVRQVFGEIATCKVAHSQKLTKEIAVEELDQDYRSEKALTVALMGLLAEESVIGQRLGKLGRKKATAA